MFESSNINLKNLKIVNKSSIFLIPKSQMVFFEFLSSSYGMSRGQFFSYLFRNFFIFILIIQCSKLTSISIYCCNYHSMQSTQISTLRRMRSLSEQSSDIFYCNLIPSKSNIKPSYQ